MHVNLETNESEYDPGDVVHFQGSVASAPAGQRPPVPALLARATVVVSLVSSDSIVLSTETVQTDRHGLFSGRLHAPQHARGELLLIAEAAVDHPSLLAFPCGWYGLARKTLVFPQNVAPELHLATTTMRHGERGPLVCLNAEVCDPDSGNDIELIRVTVADGSGCVLRQWQAIDFSSQNQRWVLKKRDYLAGVAPWKVTLLAEDSVGNVATISQFIHAAG